MIISIDDELFQKVKQIVKGRNLTLFNELESIKPLDTVATDTTDTTLAKARELKSQRVKQSIKETIQELQSQNISPTRYKINKKTGIAYVTINKYYDEIVEEIKR